VKHPKGPAAKPPVSILEGNRQYRIVEDLHEDRTFITVFNHTSDGNSELKVRQLFDTDVHSIFEAVSEQEEGRRIFCELMSAKTN
jgi:hypothetical protein